MRFVVEFAQTDVESLSRHQLERLERRVQGFIHRESAGQWVRSGELDRNTLARLAERAFQTLSMIATGGEYRVTNAGGLKLGFLVVREPSKRMRIEVIGDPLDRFLYQLVRVLQAAGVEKLRRCEAPKQQSSDKCGRLFAKVTKKRFCSVQCQSRVYMRKYRAGEVGGA